MAVDNSSSSPSFRELDDVFFQSQARIWLEEVLHMRFDEQLSISDLLSDGELLFEVSKALWNMLLVKYTELKNIKAPIDTRKSSGRYKPYSNVDSFLKASFLKPNSTHVCKVMGLTGMDLFSASDVVEKRDMRNICICIRSLSKQARCKQLNVPDFDIVTKTVAKPTEFVGCITTSLESTTSRNTHGESNEIQAGKNLGKHNTSSFASHQQEDESYLEESDDAKSSISDTSYTEFLFLESKDSPETVYKFAPTHDDFALNFDASSEPDDHGNSVLSTPDSREPKDAFGENRKLFHHQTHPKTNQFIDTRFQETALENIDFSAESFSPCWDDVKSYCSENQDVEPQNQICGTYKDLVYDITNVVESIQDVVVSKGADDNVKKDEDHLCINQSSDVHCYSEDGIKAASKDERKDDGRDCLTEEGDKRTVNRDKKSTYIAPLLKTVAKGTALIGILFLLHLRLTAGNDISLVAVEIGKIKKNLYARCYVAVRREIRERETASIAVARRTAKNTNWGQGAMVVNDLSSSTSFRELDDVFLQSQARIWLEEVLHMRFDEQLSISDLLSDGELLYDCFLSTHLVHIEIKAKVCKVMGLSGVDLFTPSDVVEKRNIRKVPDFDIVTKTVAMPTEFVGGIRRSLESSTSRNTHGEGKHGRLKFRQKSSFASHQQVDESCLDESDEAKSSFSETSYVDFLYLESGDSPETVYKFAQTHDEFDFDFDFDANSEPDDHETLTLSTPELREPRPKSLLKDSVSCNRILENVDFSSESFSPFWDDVKSYCSENQDVESRNQDCGTHKNLGDSLALVTDDITNTSKEADDNVKRNDDQLCTNRSKDERKDDGVDCLTEARDKRAVNREKKSTL
ncbi:hypothetical protein LXL04_003366 [Taraxacum kok-saghyz]